MQTKTKQKQSPSCQEKKQIATYTMELTRRRTMEGLQIRLNLKIIFVFLLWWQNQYKLFEKTLKNKVQWENKTDLSPTPSQWP